MDDCNRGHPLPLLRRRSFRFPLWTIVTLLQQPVSRPLQGSDSSMDDCNRAQLGARRCYWRCSDSSMDDCNNHTRHHPSKEKAVQIPLWTIVTIIQDIIPAKKGRSDSSMDDCNGSNHISVATGSQVQIPLWTIVTALPGEQIEYSFWFRFLYGRV